MESLMRFLDRQSQTAGNGQAEYHRLLTSAAEDQLDDAGAARLVALHAQFGNGRDLIDVVAAVKELAEQDHIAATFDIAVADRKAARAKLLEHAAEAQRAFERRVTEQDQLEKVERKAEAAVAAAMNARTRAAQLRQDFSL